MREMLLVGAGNSTSNHLIQYLLDSNQSVRAVYRKTKPKVRSENVSLIKGDVSANSVESWIHGCSAIIYMAGGDATREDAVEHLGAKKLLRAAESSAVERFIYISALGAHDPDSWGEEFRDYLLAKAKGEAAVRASALCWTIVRPGILNDQEGVGKIATKSDESTDPNVSRQDVAQTIAEAAFHRNTYRKTFDIVSGDTKISKALNNL